VIHRDLATIEIPAIGAELLSGALLDRLTDLDMAKHNLDGAQIITGLRHVGREAVSK